LAGKRTIRPQDLPPALKSLFWHRAHPARPLLKAAATITAAAGGEMSHSRFWMVLPLLVPLHLGCASDGGESGRGDEASRGDDDDDTASGPVVVAEDMLEQPLLLTRSLRNGPEDAGYDAWVPLTSQLVYFRLAGESLELRQLQAAEAGPSDQDRLLASFPVKGTDGGIHIDYGGGASVVLFEAAVYQRHDPLPVVELPILSQELARSEMTERHLIVERELTVDASQLGGEEAPARLNEAFELYQPPAGFAGRVNPLNLHFYENPPTGEQSFIHRHDAGAPIVYHVSPNTPPARRADLEVAVAYWNRLFEQVTGDGDVVQLADLPEGVADFEPGYNIIRWLDGLTPGGRGVNHTDPFTGQIIRSTIHVSPVFEVAGSDAATLSWQRALADLGQPVSPPPQEVIDRVVSDYYVNGYVHEIGHGLGLRHQFAGNLGGNISAGQADDAIVQYLSDDREEGLLWSGSVMEYVPILQAAMVGDAARSEDLPYDLEALRFGYGADDAPAPAGSYCEAEAAEVFADCRENDIGSDSIVGTYWIWEDRLAEMAFTNAAAAAAGEPLSDPAVDAQIVGVLFGDVAKQFAAGASFMSVLAGFPNPLPEDQADEYAAAVAAYQVDNYWTVAGPHVWFLDQVVASGPSQEAAAQLVAELRARTEEYAGLLGAEIDGAALDAWAAAVEAELVTVLAPLAELDFVDVTQ
jgi:hypothetical protein